MNLAATTDPVGPSSLATRTQDHRISCSADLACIRDLLWRDIVVSPATKTSYKTFYVPPPAHAQGLLLETDVMRGAYSPIF